MSDVIFLDAPQGSEEWHQNRSGHATASRFVDIIGSAASREAYLWELVAERLVGTGKRDSGGMAKRWGHESEPPARREYQIRTGNLVREVGFAVLERQKWVGCSSDGVVIDSTGCIEIKSPFNSGIHARTLALGMPPEHLAQTQGNLMVLRREWIDFLSFDPSFPAPYNLFIQHHERNEKYIAMLDIEVKKFLAEVSIAVKDIKSTYK
jgi:predicted phage-related endonuclease